MSWVYKSVAQSASEPLLDNDNDDLQLSEKARSISFRQRAQDAVSTSQKSIKRLAFFLVPSPLQGYFTAQEKSDARSLTVSPKKHSTEYLDGVRGLASLIVFNFHWSHSFYPGTNWGYGYKDNDSLWQLPFIRFIFCGGAMVHIFFVLSGFVLSHRYIQKMRAREYDAIYPSLTSLSFRRAMRLYLPSLISAIMTYLVTSFGWMHQPAVVNGKPFTHGPSEFIKFLDMHSNPLSWKYAMVYVYNAQLWSIGVEYRGSMVVFLMILSIARCTTLVRFCIETFLMIYAFGHDRWDAALFIAGILAAELDVFAHGSSTRRKVVTSWAFRITMVVMLVAGLFLSGFPSNKGAETPGYTFTKNLWPYSDPSYRRRFWLSIAAILIVIPIQFLPCLKTLFATRVAKYFGQISFALYLIHGMTNHIIGARLAQFFAPLINENHGTDIHTPVVFALASLIHYPITFWLSDIFWRAFDLPSTEFARWLEKKCTA